MASPFVLSAQGIYRSFIIEPLANLIGTIYDAVDDDRAWIDAFRQLAELTGSRSAGMFRVDAHGLGLERSWNMPDAFMQVFGSDYVAEDPRVARALAHPVGTILSDDEPTVRRGMMRSGVDALARQFDLPYTLASMFRRDRSGLWGLYVSRSQCEGVPQRAHFEQFEVVQRHVCRAINLCLKLDQADLMLQLAGSGLDGESTALFLVDQGLRLRWMDAQAEALLRVSKCLREDRGCLCINNDKASRSIQQMLTAVAQGEDSSVLHLPIERQGRHRVLHQLNVLPYRRQSRLASSEPVFLIVIRSQHRESAFDVVISARQRAVLGLLAEGLGNRDIAERLDLSVNTVRNHVQAVFDRLGARNRTECVALARRAGVLMP